MCYHAFITPRRYKNKVRSLPSSLASRKVKCEYKHNWGTVGATPGGIMGASQKRWIWDGSLRMHENWSRKKGQEREFSEGAKHAQRKTRMPGKGMFQSTPKKSVLMKWIGNAGKAGNVLEGTDGWITRIYKRVSGSILEVTRAHWSHWAGNHGVSLERVQRVGWFIGKSCDRQLQALICAEAMRARSKAVKGRRQEGPIGLTGNICDSRSEHLTSPKASPRFKLSCTTLNQESGTDWMRRR